MRHSILQGVDEWRKGSSSLKHVLKQGDIKYCQCPLNVITKRTWQIINIVNETTGGEGSEILHLPFPGTILDQPPWYREAVRIMRSERYAHQKAEMGKARSK